MIEKNYYSLSGKLPEEIFSFCGLKEKFRAEQIFQWIAKGAKTFSDMTNLSLQLRNKFENDFCIYSTCIDKIVKDGDGTVKLVIKLFDSAKIETVLLSDKNGRKTACVSCQAGCPIGCSFCNTGNLGFLRNLSAGEIVEQFFHLESQIGQLDNIVFMGMGEPFLNLDEIKKSIEILTHHKGRNLSKRRITISTSGICSGIYKLADSNLDVRLAVSLTTANQKLREQLMPIAKHNSLEDLKKAVLYFSLKCKHRVTFEIALMHNVNTSVSAAEEIIAFAKGLNCHLNIIPWNPVAGLDFTTPTESEIKKFENVLLRAGLNITSRQKRGDKINSACGQLGFIPS